ncbi:MAG: hypothetical protein EBZ24_13310, partial [Synechococcaceae bacterium WB9_4xB_025]|nr:hypothetical protein [Synechococcaceae bacterium WB9_4xB_025]
MARFHRHTRGEWSEPQAAWGHVRTRLALPRLLHTADWQIGKPFRWVEDQQKRIRLQQARIEAISRIAEHAQKQNADALLVAGDLFDSAAVPTATVMEVLEVMASIPCPVLVMQEGHPLVIWQLGVEDALFSDPCAAQERRGLDSLIGYNDQGKLQVLTLERSASSPTARFGLGWFLPALMQHRNILILVLIASFFVQLFALLNPLLIQQIIDAVITQGNLSSLNVLGTLLVGMAVAQAVLGALRTYLFSDTTNRIDITLGATIIDHLLRLPLGYFARRPVGEVSSRINELEKIRRFLTGTALTVMLDAMFAIIYIAVMMLYSISLTFWALAVVPFFVALTAAAAPIIRAQLREQAEANARV